MPSSHLFLGLPIDLLVMYFELSSGFHSAALINHLSFGDVATFFWTRNERGPERGHVRDTTAQL